MSTQPTKHILGAFDTGMKKLRDDLLVMGSLAVRGLNNVSQGLFDRNDDLCNLVIAEDEEIDNFEKKLDEDGFNMTLRYQPVARDLRSVLSAMKISTNLERVGDQCVTIARRAKKLNADPVLPNIASLEPIIEFASKMLKDSLTAFSEMDEDLAIELIARDKELDRLCHDFDDSLTVSIASDPENANGYINTLFISRALERIGDMASNIGEDIIFIAKAEDIRH